MSTKLVVDHGEGADLDRVVRLHGPLPVRQAVDYLIQAARGLEAAHAQGTIHGAIKPGTLMVDRAGIVHVLDVGSPGVAAAATRSTEDSIDMGSVDYMAPEQSLDACRADHRADIYSLGCTLYFLVTGRAPFAGETILKKLQAHREQEAPSLRANRPDVSQRLEACYQGMMAKRPDHRPGSMTEVIALLEAAELATAAHKSPKTGAALKRSPAPAFRARPRQTAVTLGALAGGLLLAAFVGVVVSHRRQTTSDREPSVPVIKPRSSEKTRPDTPPPPTQTVMEQKTIFDGTSTRGWMLCNRAPLPPRSIQRDGLNPHRTGSYLVVYEQQLGDFVLDFDFKLSSGCNSGVFLRTSDLNNPVNTGIEVALDDTMRGDDHDSGAFDGLVRPKVYAQKPARQWNHMTITALGPRLTVSLNGALVSSIDLDQWTIPGKRPDGSDLQFKNRALSQMPRSGYLGLQDLGRDCWFKSIVLHVPVHQYPG